MRPNGHTIYSHPRAVFGGGGGFSFIVFGKDNSTYNLSFS